MDDPYQTPKSALEQEQPSEPLSRLEEGIVDFMAASRVRTIVFIVLALIGCVISLGGVAEALWRRFLMHGGGGSPEHLARAVVWAFVLFHCALAAWSLWRYLTAINRVARTYGRGDLAVAIHRRRFARVGWFVMIGLLIVSVFAPMIYLD
jgi:hypothetical protein